MKRPLLALATAAISGLVVTAPVTLMAGPASAGGDYGPDTCLEGYVWREARPSDHVCVSPQERAQVQKDNAIKESRWVSGANGPHTCTDDFEWRNAFPGDDVCVFGKERIDVEVQNRIAASRVVSAKLWVTRYTVPPVDNGDGTASSTSVDDIPRLKINGDHFNLGQVRLYIRYTSGKVFWSGTVTASRHTGYTAGSFGKKTGVFDCSGGGKPANAYAQAQDVISGRWSAKVPVTVGCAVL
ncbi:hypothetical protein ACQPZZ_25840 [Microbispora sp. CA-135349]|uniref:hypothetical protein n=1 Tax=Microbispora sp. CA-135349 TaxID=3239953 RepID=UPI003D89C094